MHPILVKKAITIAWLLVIFSSMAYIFWYTDWKYSLPTPVPKQYHPVGTAAYVDLGGKLPFPVISRYSCISSIRTVPVPASTFPISNRL